MDAVILAYLYYILQRNLNQYLEDEPHLEK